MKNVFHQQLKQFGLQVQHEKTVASQDLVSSLILSPDMYCHQMRVYLYMEVVGFELEVKMKSGEQRFVLRLVVALPELESESLLD